MNSVGSSIARETDAGHGMSDVHVAEWLEQRRGPGALRDLWSRLTARHRRSFDEAFTGVFGERPDRLYGKFVAELTAASMTPFLMR